jgi:phosphatidylglycerophosphatase A
MRETFKNLDFKSPATWLATWFGCGLAHPAPGTWGTLGALPFGIMLMMGGWPALLAATVIVTAAGLWATDKVQKQTEIHDASYIVIDEAAGLWLTLLAARQTTVSVGLAFLLFRFFDILKPWPVSWCDKKLPGARGVMADDLAAGIYAALCLWGLRTYAGIG